MRYGILFRPDDGTGAGSSGPAPAPASTPAPPESPQTPPPTKIEFSKEQQAHIDALIADAKARAEAKGKTAGKTEAEQAAQRAQMDEVDRLKAEKADAEKRTADARAAANTRIVRAEAKLAAVAAGVRPERVDAALRLIDLSAISVGEDGEPDAGAIALAFTSLKVELPELFGGASGTPRSGGDFGQGPAGKRTYAQSEYAKLCADGEYFEANREELLAANREGRILFGK